MTNLIESRQNAQLAALSLFAASTKLPIIMYEYRDGDIETIFIPQESKKRFNPFCKAIRNIKPCVDCDTDSDRRVNRFYKSIKKSDLNVCHAGLWNHFLRIGGGDKTTAIMIFGEFIINSDPHKEIADCKYQSFLAENNVSEKDAIDLNDLRGKIDPVNYDDILTYRSILPELEKWFFANIAFEHRTRRESEKISHELHTRIQPIMAQAENLANYAHELSEEEVVSRANRIVLSSLALYTIVNNLALETYVGNYRFRRDNDIRSVIKKSVEIYEPEANKKGVEIRVKLQMPTWNIEFSREHIQIAINNLINNAIKYSYSGKDERKRYISIKGKSFSENYRIEIQNYGIGIMPEEINSQKIFRDGYQGSLTMHEHRTGSGKGLYFTRRIIDKHKGKISVKSDQLGDSEDPAGSPFLTNVTFKLFYVLPQGGMDEIS